VENENKDRERQNCEKIRIEGDGKIVSRIARGRVKTRKINFLFYFFLVFRDGSKVSLVEWKAEFFLFESLSLVKTAQLEGKKIFICFYAMKF
jgi:hypothetical protein